MPAWSTQRHNLQRQRAVPSHLCGQHKQVRAACIMPLSAVAIPDTLPMLTCQFLNSDGVLPQVWS